MHRLKVGITGGIGSGKSTVANIFIKLGIPVFFSDIEAAKIISSDRKTRQKIIREFGKTILSDKMVDRKTLARIVFNDNEKLVRLNSIVHPAVREYFIKWEKKQKNAPYIIQEAAILIETGIYKNLDYVILVTAPENLKIKRVMERDKISKNEVFARMKAQWNDNKKKKFANVIIVNDEKKLVLPQVLKIHKKIIRLKKLQD